VAGEVAHSEEVVDDFWVEIVVRQTIPSTLLILGGTAVSACAGGPSPSYVLGYNSNLDGGWQCAARHAPSHGSDTSEFVSGCRAAATRWFGTFDGNSDGLFGGGNTITVVPDNPKYRIPPIN
jgi:hypothetical protein